MGRHFDSSNQNSVHLSSCSARSLPPGAPPLQWVPRPTLPSPTATRREPSTSARAPNVTTRAPLEAQPVQPGRAGVDTLPPQLQTQVHRLPARNLGDPLDSVSLPEEEVISEGAVDVYVNVLDVRTAPAGLLFYALF